MFTGVGSLFPEHLVEALLCSMSPSSRMDPRSLFMVLVLEEQKPSALQVE